MTPLLAAAREALDWFAARKLDACIIGGLAVQRWGEPRLTRDVDLTVFTGFAGEEPLVDAVLASFAGRGPHARAFALERRVLLLRASNGIDLDVSLAGLPFEAEVLSRASEYEFAPEVVLRTCSAEDLIVYKMIAARPQDIDDVESVLFRQFGRLNLLIVRAWLGEFAQVMEATDFLERFEAAERKVARIVQSRPSN